MKRQCQRREQRRGKGRKRRRRDTAVSFSNRRMCIPGDNRENVLGLYSVQAMRKIQRHGERQDQHFSPQSLRERERERVEGKHPSNSAQDRQNIQSPEHVQCAQDLPSVCINKHYPATTRLVRVCRRSPLSPCSTPLPHPPIPAHRHCDRRTDRTPECFRGGIHSHARKSKLR